jgi:P4 family phage/plasmid primase-like protien
MTFEVTVLTAKRPLGKSISLDSDGSLRKSRLATPNGIEARVVRLDSLAALAEMREGLGTNNALMYGVSAHQVARVFSQEALSAGAKAPKWLPAIARDAEHFHWPAGAGVLFIDYDPEPGSPCLSADDLVATYRAAVPELNAVTMLHTDSASSNIWRADTQLSGGTGAHVYIVISDAARIPEVGKLIFDRLVLHGLGRIAVSSAGRMLQRAPADAAVYQPERQDFLHATCVGDLEQRLPPARLFPAVGADPDAAETMLDPDALPKLTAADRERLDNIWRSLRDQASPKAAAARESWSRARARTALGDGATAAEIESRANSYARCARNNMLHPCQPLLLEDGRQVTVRDLKSSPGEFDRVRMAEPLEPEYDGNDPRIAIAYLHPNGDGEPVIFSHAHGGVTYRLTTADDDLAGVTDEEMDGDGGNAQFASDGPPIIDPKDYLGTARTIAATLYRPPSRGRLVRWQGEWFQHRQSHYVEVEDELIRGDVWRFLGNCKYSARDSSLLTYKPSPASVNSVVSALTAVSQQKVERAPAWLLPVNGSRHAAAEGLSDHPPEDIVALANGLLHVPTRALHQHTSCFFNRNALPFNYDPAAACPAWLKFLDSLWPNDAEAKQCLQQWFGYLMSGDTSQQKMLLIKGPPRSGKGTIASVIRGLLGAANTAAPSLSDLSSNFGLQPVIGKLAAVIPDARDIQAQFNGRVVERLLSISGEDTMTVDRKNKEPWVGRLGARVVIMSNDHPKLGDASGALVGRFIMLPMRNSFFGKEDLGLQDRIATELPGIFNWALDGLDRLRERGRLLQPASGQALIDEMYRISNPVGAFVDDRCDVSAGYQVAKDQLFAAWRDWCMAEGRQPGVKDHFLKNLLAAYPSLESRRPRQSGARVQAIDGICLRACALDPLDEEEDVCAPQWHSQRVSHASAVH